ncbi:MAG: class I SAM-dependent methyltransferase [Saccharofermentans sp.]|mgnify:CR=1 FL=1|jgi:tRNA (adenine22-N1)-methyltransferase|nr:class I SAM-dependent methyltransferase [Mageeibacillus sp.]MCI1263434.1 class I SAM-dependent methyltransferase [Saccharofermentans sp.]MCI1274887.1 class I SAM-dependent methyltransferase [Saccharofermentans sp.]MCI1769105.1 class I SAM-dependent methyltransferase [Mageeibacillus sp.]MCI2044083.1 class I SAM-dependent methyltransferase [Mageeibacillus sp.]
MPDLTVRLECVFNEVQIARRFVGEGRVLDVGSDHGMLACHCLEKNIADSVVCTDIHESPARRSSRLLSDYGFDSRSSVLVTDGLDGVKILPGDIIVIAGMGGLNIIDILTRMTASADARVLPKIAIVLQSQKSANLVREFVCAKGFDIQGESVCNDRNLYYSIMRLTYTGESTKLSDKELYYGPRLLEQQGDETVRKYFRHLDEVYAVRSRSDKRIRALIEGRIANAD